ncbi:hypothetical protein C1646_682818 [Rhizophagus diaphanus]|nr:hypothetical protein C1646_682818 [Rhizophagus diaphanus] [Rhizophagus sp. MUCL 43196]
MAPEVLRGKSYTPASDMYSFFMIMWEFTSGVPPFNDRAHDIQLSLSICEDIKEELKCNITEFINAPIGNNNNFATASHSQACYTSQLLDFTSKQLNEILESRNLQAYNSSQSTSGKVNEILEMKIQKLVYK